MPAIVPVTVCAAVCAGTAAVGGCDRVAEIPQRRRNTEDEAGRGTEAGAGRKAAARHRVGVAGRASARCILLRIGFPDLKRRCRFETSVTTDTYVYSLTPVPVPIGVVTTTSTCPAACAGVVAVIDVAVTVPIVAAKPPMVTDVAPLKFCPVMVTTGGRRSGRWTD